MRQINRENIKENTTSQDTMANHFDPNGTAVARRTSVHELINAWEQSQADIRAAFALLVGARDRLRLFFDGSGYSASLDIAERNHRSDFEQPEVTLQNLQRQVWTALVARLELRKLMSLKRTQELDKQLESGEGLPDLTIANVMAMLETTLNNAGQYLEEKVLECYEHLRPRGWTLSDYKTNQKSVAAGVGQKVILTYAVRRSYSSARGFEVQYGRAQDELRALDQVFHLLDGKPANSASWAGELCDAISQQTSPQSNQFETAYFRGRCFGNGNLHLEFVRADLVARFNLIAGGARLREPQPMAA